MVRSCQTRKRKKKGRIQSPHVTPTLAATLHRWQAAVRRPEARTLSRASAQLSEPVPLAEISPLVPHHNSQDFDDITPLRLSVSASTLSTDRSAQPQRWRTSTPPSPCELASSSVTPCLAVSRWSCEFAPLKISVFVSPKKPRIEEEEETTATKGASNRDNPSPPPSKTERQRQLRHFYRPQILTKRERVEEAWGNRGKGRKTKFDARDLCVLTLPAQQ